MPRMTILTANMAYGFDGMDRLLPSLKHQLHIHGWGALTYEFVPSLRGKVATVSKSKRMAYVQKHCSLGRTLKMILRVAPDVLVLNEAIYELYEPELEPILRNFGFRTIAWGVSTHYPGTRLATLVATKETGLPIPCKMPQRPSMGGGAGMAGIRLADTPISVFGLHLTYRSPKLFRRQIEYVAKAAADEKAKGKDVLLAGDWNESEKSIFCHPAFAALDLMSAEPSENVTCPTFLPKPFRKPLDHVFIPRQWRRIQSHTIAFGSDHLALSVMVTSGA